MAFISALSKRDIGLALEAVHFLAGGTVVSAGGHDTDYFGAEVRYGW
jgi:hypothetical protein